MTHVRTPGRIMASAVLVVLLISVVIQAALASQSNLTSPIQHVIIIMQENHSFDNYFGTYPTANETLVNNITSRLTPVNGIPKGVCLPDVSGCVSPRLTTTETPENPVEGQSIYENDYASDSGFPLSSGPQSMVYFDYHSIAAYWDYAEEYGLADNYFAAVLGQTTPNRLMLLTGDTYVSGNYGPPPSIDFNTTVFSQLSRAGVTWGYYDFVGPTTETESTYPLNYITGLAGYRENIKDVSSLFAQLASNSGLPDVSFVNFLGKEGLDEHPPYSPDSGVSETVSVVNAVMGSKFWNSTTIFLTYDEGGGFYDHVTPPQVYSIDHNFTSPLLGLGQRVPLLVISPFSKLNYVSHVQLSHLSLLHFIDSNWGIPPLNARVAASNLPTDFFDFTQTPRAPILLGTGLDSKIPYPLPLQTAPHPQVVASNGPEYSLLIIGIFAAASVSLAVVLAVLRRRLWQISR